MARLGIEDIGQGSIVEVPTTDPRGIVAPHPVIILNKDQEILLDCELFGIVISSAVPKPLPQTCVPVPWARPRHPFTGLDRYCAAVCDWTQVFRPSDILYVRGKLPLRHLRDVVKKYLELTEER